MSKADKVFQCPECGLHYRDQELAKQCEIYCKEHKAWLLSHVSQPMLIVYGDEDIGLETDGSVNQWLARVKPIINEKTDIQIIHGAPHSFRKYEDQLTDIVDEFLRQFA